MKAWSWMALVALGGAIVGACGGGNETGTGGGGDGGSGTGTQTGTATGTASGTATGTNTGTNTGTGTGTGMGGNGICGSQLLIDQGVVDGCLTANCCDSFDPCIADAACLACLQNPSDPACAGNTMYTAFTTCFDDSCPGSICGTELGFPGSPNLNKCLTDNCCTPFNACELDPDCNACLQGTGTDCENNTLFTAHTTCRDAECPADICGTGILFGTTYPNMSQDVNFDTNKCAGASNADGGCCEEMTACVDGENDGIGDMDAGGLTDEMEVNNCLDCLIDPASSACMGQAQNVQDAAAAFDTCFAAACP